MRPGGTIVSLVGPPDTQLAAGRNVRAVFFVVEPNRDQLIAPAELVDQGKLRVEVMRTFAPASGRDAFETGLSDHARKARVSGGP
jgi:hypothetical protein